MSEDLPVFLSRNRLEGSLADTPLKSLMEPCRRHLVTGTIRIDSREGRGVLQMRAGVVDHASFGLLVGDAAVIRMSLLRDGSYQLEQRAPDLSGELGPAASLESDVSHVPLAQVMRHCEDNALSCSVIVVSAYDRAEIRYHAGELTEVTLNGVPDADAIVRITRWTEARYKLQLDPLAPEIEGWPKASREPTAPFKLERMPPPAKLAHGSGPVTTVAPPPGSTPQPIAAMVSEKITMPPPRTRAQTIRPQAVPPPPSAAILGVGEATEVTGPPDILKHLPPAKKPPALIVADEPTPAPRKRAASVHPAILDADGPLFGMRDNDSAPSEVTAPRRGKGPPPPPGKPSVLFTPAPAMAASAAPAPPREKLAPPPPPPGRRTPAQPLAAVDAVDDRPPSRPMPPPLPPQAEALPHGARGTGSQAVARPAAPMPQAQRMNTSGSWVVPHMAINASDASGKTAAPLMAKPFVREARRSGRGTWTFVAVLVLVFGGGGFALWYYAQPQAKSGGAAPASAPAGSPAKASQPDAPAPNAPAPAASTPAPTNKSAMVDADVDPQPTGSSATPASGSVAALALAAASGAPAPSSAAHPAEKARTTRQVGLRSKRTRRR